jgi:hypothetical protein
MRARTHDRIAALGLDGLLLGLAALFLILLLVVLPGLPAWG